MSEQEKGHLITSLTQEIQILMIEINIILFLIPISLDNLFVTSLPLVLNSTFYLILYQTK